MPGREYPDATKLPKLSPIMIGLGRGKTNRCYSGKGQRAMQTGGLVSLGSSEYLQTSITEREVCLQGRFTR